MDEPVYIEIDAEGRLILLGGDGTEPEPPVIWRGPRIRDMSDIGPLIESLAAWAEANGYRIITPHSARESSDIALKPTENDERNFCQQDIDDFFDLLDALR